MCQYNKLSSSAVGYNQLKLTIKQSIDVKLETGVKWDELSIWRWLISATSLVVWDVQYESNGSREFVWTCSMKSSDSDRRQSAVKLCNEWSQAATYWHHAGILFKIEIVHKLENNNKNKNTIKRRDIKLRRTFKQVDNGEAELSVKLQKMHNCFSITCLGHHSTAGGEGGLNGLQCLSASL